MCLLLLAVFVDTPTREPRDPPSTSFCTPPKAPFGVGSAAARYARHRCASPEGGRRKQQNTKLQKGIYTDNESVPEC